MSSFLYSLKWTLHWRRWVFSFPVTEWVSVFSIVNYVVTLFISSLQSTMWIDEGWFMEWLSLIISISILCSEDISVGVVLSLPWCLVEQLCISLETGSNCAGSVSISECVIEFNFGDTEFLVSIGLSSIIWLQISLSESCAPFFI